MHRIIKPHVVKIIISALVLLLVVLVTLLAREYTYVRRQDKINSYKGLIDNLRHKKPLVASDVDIITPWMTFGYLTSIFHLPPNYLKDNLQISISQYPNISIGKYARIQKISSMTLVDSVKKLITDYFTNKNPL